MAPPPRSLLALAAAAVAAGGVAAFMPPVTEDGWYQGRATFFGAPDAFTKAFDNRGDGSFGDFMFGSCGYFNKPRAKQRLTYDDVPFPHDGVAALADVNPDFPGSCGRCYEVKCAPGLLMGNNHSPIQLSEFYNMASVRTDVKDSFGRAFPGNPYADKNRQYVDCWSEDGKEAPSSIVRIVDNCPTAQFKDGRTVPQMWCAADVYHIDLSYWAFEKLAHPLYGAMGVQFRPIDCDTKKALALLPGAISRTIYHDGTGVGWSWQSWKSGYQLYSADGSGRGGSHAVCASLMVGGGMRFICRGCDKPGYQPFNYGAKALEFSVKADTSVLDFAASPKDSIPPLKVFLVRGSDEQESFDCGDIFTQSYKNVQAVGEGFFKFTIPLSDFKCRLADLTGVGFTSTDDGTKANINGPYTAVCLDDIRII